MSRKICFRVPEVEFSRGEKLYGILTGIFNSSFFSLLSVKSPMVVVTEDKLGYDPFKEGKLEFM